VKPHPLIGLVLAVLSSAGMIPTQEMTTSPVSLAECLDIALRHNPLLLSSWEEYKASLARIRQAYLM